MIIPSDILIAAGHRLRESNKIFTALDNAETNVAAKLHLRQAIRENEGVAACIDAKLNEHK